MTNKELEQEIKRLEEQIKDLKAKLEEKVKEESFLPYKPYEVEVPEDLEDYYFIDAFGDVQTLYGFSKKFVHSHYQRGIAFKTREEVEQYDKERILLFKLHKWAEEHNEGWTPNWNESESKYFVEYDSSCGSLDFDSYYMLNPFSKLPYFKSEEIVKQFIKEFGDEIKEMFC